MVSSITNGLNQLYCVSWQQNGPAGATRPDLVPDFYQSNRKLTARPRSAIMNPGVGVRRNRPFGEDDSY
jgi:hypothetical protein